MKSFVEQVGCFLFSPSPRSDKAWAWGQEQLSPTANHHIELVLSSLKPTISSSFLYRPKPSAFSHDDYPLSINASTASDPSPRGPLPRLHRHTPRPLRRARAPPKPLCFHLHIPASYFSFSNSFGHWSAHNQRHSYGDRRDQA